MSKRGKLICHFKYLLAIIFVFFGSVNALKENIGASNPIIEATYDLMVLVIIPVVLTIDIDSEKFINASERRELRHILKYLKLAPTIVLFPLQIWFCIQSYYFFNDEFFIMYFIAKNIVLVCTTFSTTCISCCLLGLFYLNNHFNTSNDSKKTHKTERALVFPSIIVSLSIFTVDLVFLILAANRNGDQYVDMSTYLFVLVPISVSFVAGMLLYIHIFRHVGSPDEQERIWINKGLDFKGLKDWVGNAIKREQLERATSIVSFCSELIFCAIVAPSVLWIKTYLFLSFLSYSMNDLYLKLKHKQEDCEKSEHKQKNSTATSDVQEFA
ncbi:12811_t:CDS:1 [Dentiscutata heterogama]|uniref:12811_t:CDS:1 n=1 Tax=Dentiscutata heterogama TaxID=1316150 RepID=A0ACA9K2U2_9GLOM|nr:12811_t:CDS:1 [Dentiscutata heterogama]